MAHEFSLASYNKGRGAAVERLQRLAPCPWLGPRLALPSAQRMATRDVYLQRKRGVKEGAHVLLIAMRCECADGHAGNEWVFRTYAHSSSSTNRTCIVGGVEWRKPLRQCWHTSTPRMCNHVCVWCIDSTDTC